MTSEERFWLMGEERFALLVTYRRDGTGVATTVWVARDGDHLVVTTPSGSGKVKRLHRDQRVLLVPCGRLGRVPFGAAVVSAVGRVAGPDGDQPSAVAALSAKYGLQYRLVLALEGAARRRRGGDAGRVILRLQPEAPA
ncbi:PPOX class F420-dependent oxidoreductase [Quadrisphaera sp. INWT6]|uniref:PPOX class F420-dependent oxidoreductase n=1 Tax=Quadrisphaera sp. INWT6 TaxID=2596917 RepID=UPI0019D631F1|nr:PPOX class F420-dependent oxidoreductase [Quadrisphaera sp. INWT6]